MDVTHLSLIIPAFNASRYLEHCLDSIRADAKDDVETIVVDDGSTDDTAHMLSHYQQQHQQFRLRLLHQENHGVSVARNNGLRYAQGRFVSFVDADDELEPEWYQKVAPFFNSSFDIISFRLATIQKNTQSIDRTIPTGSLSPLKVRALYCTSGSLNSACARLISSKYITEAGANFKPGLSMGEDALFMGRLIEDDASFFQSDQVLYRYISNPGSSTHTTTRLDYDPSLILLKYRLSSDFSPESQIKSRAFLFNSFISSIRSAVRNGRVSWRQLQKDVPHYWQSTRMEDICQGLNPSLDLRRRMELNLVSHGHYWLLKSVFNAELFVGKLLRHH